MTALVMKKLPRISAEEKEAKKIRASSAGGSCYLKKTGKRLLTMLTVSKGFQEAHKIHKMNFVTIKFNPKTKVVQLVFRKKAIEGETYAVNRQDGTAYIQMDSVLNRFELQLVKNLYRDEYVFRKGQVLVDLSDNVEEKSDPAVPRRFAPDGALLPFNQKEEAKAERAREEIVEQARERETA